MLFIIDVTIKVLSILLLFLNTSSKYFIESSKLISISLIEEDLYSSPTTPLSISVDKLILKTV